MNTFSIKYSEEVHTPFCDDRLQEKSITIKWTEILRQEKGRKSKWDLQKF